MSKSFFGVFSNNPGSAVAGHEPKKLSRSESRRAKDGSQVNMASRAVSHASMASLTQEHSVGLLREESISKKYGLRKEASVSKKKSKEGHSRRGSSFDKRKNPNSRNGDEPSRRGSVVPGSSGRKVSAIFYVPELHKTADNQVINLNCIQDELHTFRMIKWSADLATRIRSPMDDLETLSVPVSSKSFAEIIKELFVITSNYRYMRQIEILTWARDKEMIEDVLCAFANQLCDFDSTVMTSKILESLGASAAWEAIHKAVSDIYVWFPVHDEYKTQSLLQKLGPEIVNHLLVVIGNWVWHVRQSHVDLCTQISIWFNKFSAQEWKKTNIPVVYGAFKDGYDITSLFAQIFQGCSSLDLVKMNFLCTKITIGLEKFPNQKEFIHLDLYRQFVELRSKLLIMSRLLQLCRILEVDKERIYMAIAMYQEKETDDSKTQNKETEKNSKAKNSEKICVFSRIHRTKQAKQDLINLLPDLNMANTASSFSAAYSKVLKTDLVPSFKPFYYELAASFIGPIKYDLPDIVPKSGEERRRIEAIVRKLTPKKEVIRDESSAFIAGGISVQIDDSNDTIPEISIFGTDPDNEVQVLQPISEAKNTYSNYPGLDDVELDDVLTMPESVCQTHFTLYWDDKDTIEALYGISFGNVNFGDIKRILKIIGCTILTEDGIGLVVTHPRSKINISFLAPFPDMNYKLYALDRIKNALEDFLGIYYENFDYK